MRTPTTTVGTTRCERGYGDAGMPEGCGAAPGAATGRRSGVGGTVVRCRPAPMLASSARVQLDPATVNLLDDATICMG